MKSVLLSFATACALLSAAASFAAPVSGYHDDDKRRPEYTTYNDRNDRDFNYGYDKKHRVTPAEKARWEAAQRPGRRDDYRAEARRDNSRYDERNNRDFNYGYEKNHRVTAAERARWEAAHRRYDHR